MAKLSHYIAVGTENLRCGYTTGTCATAASLGSAKRLISNTWSDVISIETPSGIIVEAELLEKNFGEDYASCAVCKDGGDDPDATDGALIFSRVEKIPENKILIDGGEGVGRVTRSGLDQDVGEAAINSTPRRMISEALSPLIEGKDFGFLVKISVPDGAKIAKRTFNPRLGIEGGISILGTSGIVRPMSESALIESVKLEIRTIKASGSKHIILTPGNYGEDFSRDVLGLSTKNTAICSNYIGEAIDCAVFEGFESILLVGHFGKLAKISAGCMNTHSKVCDARRETICTHTAMCGGDSELVRKIFDCVSTDAAVQLLIDANICEEVMKSISDNLRINLIHRAGDVEIESLFFSNKFGILGKTEFVDKLIKLHK